MKRGRRVDTPVDLVSLFVLIGRSRWRSRSKRVRNADKGTTI